MAGKVTVGLSSHWPCITDNSGITTYGLKALNREMSTRLRSPVEHGRLYLYLSGHTFVPVCSVTSCCFATVTSWYVKVRRLRASTSSVADTRAASDICCLSIPRARSVIYFLLLHRTVLHDVVQSSSIRGLTAS